MTDNYSWAGVGMTMTRINTEGEVEPIKDRRIETRVDMLVKGDIKELRRRYKEWSQQAKIEKQKCENKRVKNSIWRMRYNKSKDCLQMAHAYKAVIARLQEESA